MATNQTIRFSLKENKLQSRDTVPFAAAVRGYKTVGREEIVSAMPARWANGS